MQQNASMWLSLDKALQLAQFDVDVDPVEAVARRGRVLAQALTF